MTKDDVFYLGYIASKHGLNNSVLVKLDVDNAAQYATVDGVFVELNKALVPLFISKAKVGKNNELIVELEDVSDIKSFIGCSVYLPLEQLPTLEGNKFYFHEVIGYAVTDKIYGEIGFIETVLDYPHQQIFSIKHQGKEILIPIVDDFILEVNKTSKTILLNAPEGLIDLYLNNSKHDEEE